MLDDEAALYARYGNARPGLTLVAIEDAAIPVTVVQTEVPTQERKPLPLLNEFVLRFTRSGLVSAADIADICGLEPALVEGAVADEVAIGHMTYAPARGSVALTPLGIRTSQELEAVQPVQKQLKIPFDRLTWKVANYNPGELMRKRDATEQGMLVLPAARSARIGAEEITVPALNGLLRGQGNRGSSVEILAVQKVRPNTHRYLPVKLLVYGDEGGTDVEVSVVVEDQLSSAHDLSLASLGGAAALGVSVGCPHRGPSCRPNLRQNEYPLSRRPRQ